MKKAEIIGDRRIKIVATVGPVSKPIEVLEKLFLAGVNVFRLNFSHGSHEDHQEAYNNIRQLENKYNYPIAVLADMQGPKLRIGQFKEGKVKIKAGEQFRLDLNPELGDSQRVCLPHPQIFEALTKGSELLIDDGKLRLKVENFGKDYADTKVIIGGEISNHKGVNFPSGILKLSPLTEKDLKDLEFALSLGVDFIALSFVQLAEDLLHAKDLIKGRAKIISKIEKPSAIEHIDAIIKNSDAIMVARGDLGVEIPTEDVPIVQKQIIKNCRQQGKPVIVATQMLDSMVNYPAPTRAEASDVANAVYDGADAVMLSAESTIGKYPVEAVQTMAHIVRKVEKDDSYWARLKNDYPTFKYPLEASEAISSSVGVISDSVNARYIVAFTTHGTTVDRICRERVKSRCIAFTSSKLLYRQMKLNWGVATVLVDPIKAFSEIVSVSKNWITENCEVEVGDRIVVVAGSPVGVAGLTNTIRVIEID